MDNEIPTRFELNGSVQRVLNLLFCAVAKEERNLIVIMFHVFRMARHQHVDEVMRGREGIFALDQHFLDVFII